MATETKGFHEAPELLSERTKDLHRALLTVIEELEAVDWYEQRAEAASDPELKRVILHHRDEEIEHACMAFEWIRRMSPEFDEAARAYFFTQGPITELEEAATGKGEGGAGPGETSPGSLGIGKLKRS
mgnify:CR=1 FL=1